MTLQERAKLATEARTRRAAERAEALHRLTERGEMVKRAAYSVGVSARTASRYRKAWR